MSFEKIWLDLDGVFADFQTKFESVCGFPYYQNPAKAWSLLEKEFNLFLNLEVLEGSLEVFHRAKSSGLELEFLTALPLLTGNLRTAPDDKEAWVRKHICQDTPVTCVENWRFKKMFASKHSILVDDSARNIDQWSAAGGTGILHTSPTVTIRALKELNVI